jgi:hypothetical protein
LATKKPDDQWADGQVREEKLSPLTLTQDANRCRWKGQARPEIEVLRCARRRYVAAPVRYFGSGGTRYEARGAAFCPRFHESAGANPERAIHISERKRIYEEIHGPAKAVGRSLESGARKGNATYQRGEAIGTDDLAKLVGSVPFGTISVGRRSKWVG